MFYLFDSSINRLRNRSVFAEVQIIFFPQTVQIIIFSQTVQKQR